MSIKIITGELVDEAGEIIIADCILFAHQSPASDSARTSTTMSLFPRIEEPTPEPEQHAMIGLDDSDADYPDVPEKEGDQKRA